VIYGQNYVELDSSGKFSLCKVNIEEIHVKHRLHDTRDDRDRIPRILSEIPVYPIDDVQTPVDTESGHVMCCDSFCFACSLDHEELRKDSDRFEEDRE